MLAEAAGQRGRGHTEGALKRMAKAAEPQFDRDGLRIGLEAAQKAFDRRHPKAPGLRALAAAAEGRGSLGAKKAADFVDPIVSFRPKRAAALPDAEGLKGLKGVLRSSLSLEVEALKAFGPAQVRGYRALQRRLAEHPDGVVALRQMLLDGKLSLAARTDAERPLLDALVALSRQDLDGAIAKRRDRFLAELVQEINNPATIAQMRKGTCAATACGQMQWVMRDPAGYVDFVAGLASPAGKAKLPNGQWVQRPADWAAGNDRHLGLRPGEAFNTGRSVPGQLVQPTLMQVGYDKAYRYRNTFDMGFQGDKSGKLVMEGGLYPEQGARLMEAIFPGEAAVVAYPDAAMRKGSFGIISKQEWAGQRTVLDRKAMVADLANRATPENPIPALVDYQLGGGHAVLVTGVDAGDKGQWVRYLNPWGQEEVMRSDAFASVLWSTVSTGLSQGVVG